MAYSTMTASEIERNPKWWTDLEEQIKSGKVDDDELKVVGAKTLKVSYATAGVILDGLTYSDPKTKRTSDAHITITPGDKGYWSFFHFTIVGGVGKNAYFKLHKSPFKGLHVEKTNCTVINNGTINVNDARYFWRDVPSALVEDMKVIMRAFLDDKYEDGWEPNNCK